MPEALSDLFPFLYRSPLTEIFGLLLIVFLLLILRRVRSRKTKIKTQAVLRDELNRHESISPASQTLEPDHTPEPLGLTEKTLAKEVPLGFEARAGFLDRLRSGLLKTRQSLSKRFDVILAGKPAIDHEALEEIEEALITSDVGVSTTTELISRISEKIEGITGAEDFKQHLKTEMLSFIGTEDLKQISGRPHVILVVGVNGVGKTTTIGKLAARYAAEGKKVLLAASDTFRAAAVEQLEAWAERAGAEIVKHRDKADPAAVAFDSVEAAVARQMDIVLVDTAGRLHTKTNLMEQLKKIKRSISKKIPNAPHEALLVLDATTGQNAVAQARLFNDEIGVTGIILTKLDGTAKGGIVIAIGHELKIPIRYIGIGEGIEDLQPFDPKLFVDALL